MRVLLVDDEPLVLAGIARMLAAEPCVSEVYTAEDGFQALDLLREHRPDLLITDIRMPEMDGLELIRRVRQGRLCGHFVIISSYADFDYAQQAISLGVESYLLNPVGREELRTMLMEMQRRILSQPAPAPPDPASVLLSGAEALEAGEVERFLQALVGANGGLQHPSAVCLVQLTALAAQHGKFLPPLRELLSGAGFAPRPDEPPFDGALRVLRRAVLGKEPSPNAKRILSYLIENYTQPTLSLQALADATQLHPNYASGIISKELGTQFVKYINLLRVIHAQRLLLDEEPLTVQAIAERSGFENYNHFFRVFKSYAKMPPGEYKAKRGI